MLPAEVQHLRKKEAQGFNRHPPLGVNATAQDVYEEVGLCVMFQWAPTLGGECYRWGDFDIVEYPPVSMGTHPWG